MFAIKKIGLIGAQDGRTTQNINTKYTSTKQYKIQRTSQIHKTSLNMGQQSNLNQTKASQTPGA